MTEVRIVPAVLICSGHKEDDRYKNPFVKIISPPNRKFEVKVGWDDNVKISVPIIYHESTTLKDIPKFSLNVTNENGEDGSYGFQKSRSFTGKDVKGRYTGFKKALRIKIPNPTKLPDDTEYIPDQIILPKDTFYCRLYVELKMKEWSDNKTKERLEKGENVTVTIERKKSYVVECPRCHSKLQRMAVLGMPDQSEFYSLLGYLQKEDERRHWEQIAYEHEFGRILKIPDGVNTITELLAWNFSTSLGIPQESVEDVLDWMNYIWAALSW